MDLGPLSYAAPGRMLGAGNARKQLRYYYQNVCSLRSKLTNFYLCVLESDFNIFACTETLLNVVVVASCFPILSVYFVVIEVCGIGTAMAIDVGLKS